MDPLNSPCTSLSAPPLFLVYIKLLIWVHINRSQHRYRKGIPQKLTTGGDNKPIHEIVYEIIVNNGLLNSQLKQKMYDY